MAKRAEHLPAMPPMDPGVPAPSGLRVAYAKHLLNNHLRDIRYERIKGVHRGDHLPEIDLLPSKEYDDPLSHIKPYTGRVAIVGAGVTGLYLAMMLKYLNINNVDIYEASDRVGGRVYTYNFPDDAESPCPHNYYDIGAMRIPEIDAMKSTLVLIDQLKLNKQPYVLDAGCEPQMHWYSNSAKPNGDRYYEVLKGIIAEQVIPGQTKFQKWIDDNDEYSTRAYLMLNEKAGGWDYDETEEAEAAATSTGLFDQSIVESLCDYSDFQATEGKPWYRLEGGMSVVTEKMNECIEDPKWVSHNPTKLKVKTKCPVTAMRDNIQDQKIEVTFSGAGGSKTESYDMVFNTTAMGPLQRMDIKGLIHGFGPARVPDQILTGTREKVLTGIRALSYDRACKVAIKFKTRWWKGMYKNSKVKTGGVSGSDLPISNVVYPSWDDGDKSAVLIVSYTWAQDATRMGALIPDYSKQDPSIDDEVVTQCFADLAKIWAQPEGPKITSDTAITADYLRSQYITHHAYAWSHDPYMGGAFALFGPGQFKYIYPEFQKLFCGGKFAICGEALSPHHAWISGALDSGYYTMLRWLVSRGEKNRIDALKASWFGNGKDEHVAEFDEQLLQWSVELGQKQPEERPKKEEKKAE
ncbi:hypothetical protein F53441_884 [Fusarium austroafricanum]|uniref:Amine oxidase domain-containing protein n=1 Tax=Fusarium austroafricanum TaxID=2364996 RepID=A0A8H4P5P3_9HYPO|nr:hypothetical protein F53441_884 [Fusarium austroafricanum]